MDPRDDPYTPNAGAQPPELAGRDEEIEAFSVLLDRLWEGRTGQSLMLTGWRGTGKTVLLNRFRTDALSRGWATVDAEVVGGAPFAPEVARLCRRALLSVAPSNRWADAGRRAAAVLQSFTLRVDPDGAVTAGLDVDAAVGLGDSGVLADDLTDVLVGLGEAAQEHATGVVLLLDELHGLPPDDLAALVAALHKTVQRGLPVTLVGAGLPRLRRDVTAARSYAERLFRFPLLGLLTVDATAAALTRPAEALGVGYEDGAVDAVAHYTEGHPYFVQEFGSVLWAVSSGPGISVADVYAAVPVLERRLDEGFFRVRTERASAAERAFLAAMAATGDGPCATRDVAAALGRSVASLSGARRGLVDKGLVHVPSSGTVDFTVPRFAAHLRRSAGS